MKQLANVSLKDGNDSDADGKHAKIRDAGMAKLHALLTIGATLRTRARTKSLILYRESFIFTIQLPQTRRGQSRPPEEVLSHGYQHLQSAP